MYMIPFTNERPWGHFRQYTHNEQTTVKTLFVRHGGTLSLQHHAKRTEFWRVLSGAPDVTIGDKVIHASVGEEFEISAESLHRLAAPNGDIEVLEIAFGEFDEEDIVRIEDSYGRA
jgi:mannose-6-phosphate isomerase-like protein (cupin superfamily)